MRKSAFGNSVTNNVIGVLRDVYRFKMHIHLNLTLDFDTHQKQNLSETRKVTL